jgi:hypothetical protein
MLHCAENYVVALGASRCWRQQQQQQCAACALPLTAQPQPTLSLCLPALQLFERFRPGQKPPAELGPSRDYNVDLVPKFIMVSLRGGNRKLEQRGVLQACWQPRNLAGMRMQPASKPSVLCEPSPPRLGPCRCHCRCCHQANGKGAGPIKPVDGSAVVLDADKSKQIAVLLNGQNNGAMPAWKQLSDTEIAAVITYTKNNWSNKTGQIVQPAEVLAARK